MEDSQLNSKNKIGVGLIGAGFMGRCHANAFRSVGGIFNLDAEIRLGWLADIDEDSARRNAEALGFSRFTSDWREVVAASDVDIVAITAPNVLHEPIAMEAIANGKNIYCEKPLATDSDAARRMTEAAEHAGIVTLVGFNFISNPLMALTRGMITSGEIGTVTNFRGRHAEDYMAGPDYPHSFRTETAGGGALADLGSHIISIARHLIGPISEVCGNLKTVYGERPVALGSSVKKPVEVDDTAHALLKFENGATGMIEANWAATGRTMDLSFEVTGESGSIKFTQERMNELHVWISKVGTGRGGYVKVEAGPDHHPYGHFCPAPGHQLGFNDLKVIEVARLIQAVTGGDSAQPDFREALRVQETVDAIRNSSMHKVWKRV